MPEPSPIAGFDDFDACYAWLMEVDGQPTDYLRAARLLAFSQGEPYPEVLPTRYAVEMEFGKVLDRFDMFTPTQNPVDPLAPAEEITASAIAALQHFKAEKSN